ncbi:MAG TPA: hypothetical protein K8V46_14985, partial [Alcaligenes faecalis]
AWTKVQKKHGSATGFHHSGVLLDLSHPEKAVYPLSKGCRAFGLFQTSSSCVLFLFAAPKRYGFTVFKAVSGVCSGPVLSCLIWGFPADFDAL